MRSAAHFYAWIYAKNQYFYIRWYDQFYIFDVSSSEFYVNVKSVINRMKNQKFLNLINRTKNMQKSKSSD